MDRLDKILMAISAAKVEQMQSTLSRVWQSFMYREVPLFDRELKTSRNYHQDTYTKPGSNTSLPYSLPHFGEGDDAFATILQWLYGRRVDRSLTASI